MEDLERDLNSDDSMHDSMNSDDPESSPTPCFKRRGSIFSATKSGPSRKASRNLFYHKTNVEQKGEKIQGDASVSTIEQKGEKIQGDASVSSIEQKGEKIQGDASVSSIEQKGETIQGDASVPNECKPKCTEIRDNDESNYLFQDNVSISNENVTDREEWFEPRGHQPQIGYTGTGGIAPEVVGVLLNCTPYDYFRAIVDNGVLDRMVQETNLYATQKVEQSKDVPPKSRLHAWDPTTPYEMRKFIGLLGWMGLVQFPTISDYWSTSTLYKNEVAPNTTSRNRFELLLQMWHFSDYECCPTDDGLHKVQPLLDMINKKFQELYTPGETVCVNETLVPFTGRSLLKQCQAGVRVFKLCADKGYTWNIFCYSGKEADDKMSVPTNVVMSLTEKLLGHGRTIVVDSYYTSLELANQLLDRNTHLLGTLSTSRTGNPREVVDTKLKRGEVIAAENGRGITVIKWHDGHDQVLMLSTKHSIEIVETRRRDKTAVNLKAVVDYNAGKSSTDLSDQMSSNATICRSLQWYRKLAVEVILGTAVVNAHFLYKKINEDDMKITKFKEEVVKGLLNAEGQVESATAKIGLGAHTFQRKSVSSRIGRKYCKGCYKKLTVEGIKKSKVKKVNTYCVDCVGSPHYCLECFNEKHKL